MSPVEQAKRALRTAHVWLLSLGMATLIGLQALSLNPLKETQCLLEKATLERTGMSLSSMSLELAGTGAQVISLIEPVAKAPEATPPRADGDRCASLRIEFLQDQHARIDAGVFMPLYATLSLLLSAWVALHALEAANEPGPKLDKGVRWAVGAVFFFTALLLALDHRENARAMDLLASVASAQASQTHPASLDAAAQAMRQASWLKWLASSPWLLALGWALKPWRSADMTRLQGWSRAIARVLFLGGGVMFFGGAIWAAVSGAWQGPVQVLQSGMALALAGMLVTGALVHATPAAERLKSPPPAFLATGPMRDFHLEEYKQLRDEMTTLLARIETLFRAAIIAAASAFAWLATHTLGVIGLDDPCLKLPGTMVTFAWFIPPAFVLGTALMSCTMGGRVRELGGYLLQLEQALGRRADLGWEAYLARQNTTVTPMVKFLWVLLLAATLTATWVGLNTLNGAARACPDSPSSEARTGGGTPIATWAPRPSGLTALANDAMSPRTRPRPSLAPTACAAGTSGSTTRWGRG